jgi:GNAT superfamily N-acetyltransferase
MEVKNLTNENLKDIVGPCVCEEWIERFVKNNDVNIERVRKGFSKGAELRIDWIKKWLPLGYGAKIAYEKEWPIGFIDYFPIETARDIFGQDITLINCVLIIPNPIYRDKGCGKLLLEAVEIDVKKLSKGIAVRAHNHPRWMPASFFAKRGYKVVDEQDGKIKEMLMLKIFQSVEPPKFVRQKYTHEPKLISGKVVVEIFWSGVCPHNLLSVELLKNALSEFGNKVLIKEVATNDLPSDVIKKYGHGYGIYINGNPNFWLMGASRDEIHQEIESNL